ncbi:hypothetical protein [Actinoplanes teichomyceticus]|uniref:hypothetical protein n=1 Tax=Actinoplanes teichomyceticus TaxID=1867 RepID=UPI0011A99E7A|nr:hypothetical protein [Actinoplanes teichomyceticus]
MASAALILPIGALGDRYGRRNVLIIGTVVFALAPDTREEEHHGRFDIAGALTTCVAVGSLVYAIIEGNETSWTDAPSRSPCLCSWPPHHRAGAQPRTSRRCPGRQAEPPW